MAWLRLLVKTVVAVMVQLQGWDMAAVYSDETIVA
jgi:hypothetical protein